MSERDPVESVRRLPPREEQTPPGEPEPKVPEAPAPPSPPRPESEAGRRSERPPTRRVARAGAGRRRGGVDQVRDVTFPIVFRGYDRTAVDAYVGKVSQLVAELEATQLREGVVQRALDEVGEQTSGILQHAHDTAEEITARSRSQAEGRIQRAEREAAQIRQEAQQFAEQVQADTARLREERLRLIDEIRRFADEVLGVADDALERLPDPEPAAPADDHAPGGDAAEGGTVAEADDTTRELRPPRSSDPDS